MNNNDNLTSSSCSCTSEIADFFNFCFSTMDIRRFALLMIDDRPESMLASCKVINYM